MLLCCLDVATSCALRQTRQDAFERMMNGFNTNVAAEIHIYGIKTEEIAE